MTLVGLVAELGDGGKGALPLAELWNTRFVRHAGCVLQLLCAFCLSLRHDGGPRTICSSKTETDRVVTISMQGARASERWKCSLNEDVLLAPSPRHEPLPSQLAAISAARRCLCWAGTSAKLPLANAALMQHWVSGSPRSDRALHPHRTRFGWTVTTVGDRPAQTVTRVGVRSIDVLPTD